jgi:hypothetical protein
MTLSGLICLSFVVLAVLVHILVAWQDLRAGRCEWNPRIIRLARAIKRKFF